MEKKYRRNQAPLKPLCHNRSSFQDPPKAKKRNPTRHDNLDSFQDPRPTAEKECDIPDLEYGHTFVQVCSPRKPDI